MTGAYILLGSIIRRDRVKTAIWIATVVGFVFYSVATFQSTYSTPEEFASYARVVADSPVARAFSGPGHGLDGEPTLGAVLANETLSFLSVAIALMSIFLVVRNTRAEEEDGRAELLAAGQISHHARSIAALIAAIIANLTIGLLVVALLVAYGLELTGSILYAAALAGGGIFFAGLALVAAQLSVHARVANAIAGGVLGAAYLLRALGDLAENWLVWLSPIGWVQSVQPFAANHIQVLALLLAFTAGLVAAALLLERRRDLGAGLIGSRPGPPNAAPSLSRPLGLPLRLQRVAILAWILASLVLGITYGSVTDEVERMISENPELAEYLAQSGGDLVDSYFATVLLVIALVATGFAIQSLLRIRSEETSGRAEAVLATALSRSRWMAGYLAVTAAGVALILTVGGAGIGIGYLLSGGDTGEVARFAAIAMIWIPGVLVIAGLAFVLISFLPRVSQAAWGLLAFAAAAAFFGQALNLPGWIRDLSPFEHVPQVPAESLSATPLIGLAAVAAILTALGATQLGRRDIG